MSFFQDFNKVKKQKDMLELKDLNQNDGEAQLQKMTQMAQARIRNFERVYHYLDEEIIQSRSTKGMDDIPKLVKEAKSDLDEMLKIIQEMQQIKLYTKTENSLRQQTLSKLNQAFDDSKEKLKKITDQLQQKQQTTIQSAKQSIQEHHESQLDVQLLDELHYDEQFIERRQKQINEIGQVVYQLNQMMTDGARMIEAQGAGIDIISGNIKEARVKVEGAVTEVKKAAQVQQGGNGRILFFCGVSTLIIVIIILLFRAGSREHPDPNSQTPTTQN